VYFPCFYLFLIFFICLVNCLSVVLPSFIGEIKRENIQRLEIPLFLVFCMFGNTFYCRFRYISKYFNLSSFSSVNLGHLRFRFRPFSFQFSFSFKIIKWFVPDELNSQCVTFFRFLGFISFFVLNYSVRQKVPLKIFKNIFEATAQNFDVQFQLFITYS